MFIRFSIVGTTLAALTACGGSETGGNNVSFAATTVSHGDSLRVEESTAGGSRRVFVNGSVSNAETLAPNAAKDQNVFLSFTNGANTRQLYEAKSEFGTVSVFAITNVGGEAIAGARADSFGGAVPTVGTASYTGEYVGFLTGSDTQSVITGTVNLDASFADSTISGSITDRERFLTSNGIKAGDMFDVDLARHGLANGASQSGGIATGGALGRTDVYVPENPVAGTWNVALGGDNAEAAGGTVEIIHDYENSDFVETGGFAAIKD